MTQNETRFKMTSFEHDSSSDVRTWVSLEIIRTLRGSTYFNQIFSKDPITRAAINEVVWNVYELAGWVRETIWNFLLLVVAATDQNLALTETLNTWLENIRTLTPYGGTFVFLCLIFVVASATSSSFIATSGVSDSEYVTPVSGQRCYENQERCLSSVNGVDEACGKSLEPEGCWSCRPKQHVEGQETYLGTVDHHRPLGDT